MTFGYKTAAYRGGVKRVLLGTRVLFGKHRSETELPMGADMNHWRFDQGRWISRAEDLSEHFDEVERRKLGFGMIPLLRYGDFNGFGAFAFTVYEWDSNDACG